MDTVSNFEGYFATTPSGFDESRSFQCAGRRDVLDGAAITIECGPHILHASAGLHADAVIAYPDIDWNAPGDAMIDMRITLGLRQLARIANLGAPEDMIWVRSSKSEYPLASFRVSDIPGNFVTPDYIQHIVDRIGRNNWWTVSAFIRDGRMYLNGWAIAPKGWRGGLPSVSFDGLAADSIEPAASAWSDSAYWFLDGRMLTGFLAIGKIQPEGGYTKIELSFGDADASNGVERFPVYQLMSQEEATSLPIPPDENIHRVSGPGANRYSYLNGGKSDFEHFRSLIGRYAGRSDVAGLDVLDWGVGCGRLARHFIEGGANVTGIDIDAGNIAWCADNLTPGAFHTVPLNPPTSLADDSFDVIISSSVLSHLTEPVMREWLTEMSRVLKSDGVALLSFNGDGNSYFYGSIHAPAIQELDGSGFYDEWKTPDLDGVIDDTEYYRLTLMSTSCATRIFSEQTSFQGIVQGVTSGHQDVAVLRKKQG